LLFPVLVQGSRGGRKNKTRKRRASAPARKKKYVRTFYFFIYFLVRFLGVSRQGEFENTRKLFEYVSKQKSPGKYFFVLGEFFEFLFLSIFFVALVKRLSVRGTQKRDKKVLRGRASISPPPYRFVFRAFLGVSR
jgi:hypothetical protein